MIVRMSKVEIAGPKNLLREAVARMRELGIFQIDPQAIGTVERDEEKDIRSFSLDETTAVERLYLEDLRAKINDLLGLLPSPSVRESYIDPAAASTALAGLVDRHVVLVRDRASRRDALNAESAELARYRAFLGSIEDLLEHARETPDIDFIGLTIREPEMVGRLRDALSRITDWKYDLQTERAEDGTLIGLITVEKTMADRVKKTLSDEQVPELAFPASFGSLSFAEKIAYIRRRMEEVSRGQRAITEELERFALRWTPLYRKVRDWIDERLLILTATAAAYETRMCFFVHGWMPSRDVERLRRGLRESFGPQVAVEENEIREQDLERVPIALRNPPFFRMFEILTALLPLPAYTSYDPTPYIGIFFPIFFGIILGDAGYGLVIAVAAAAMRRRFRSDRRIRDGASILMVSACYAVLFGVLFGEFFGDLPERLFHITPICIERRTAIIPMLAFSVALGAGHVILGLVLGAVNAFRRKAGREGLFKLLTIALIFCLAAVVFSLTGGFPRVLTRPVIIVILFLTPFLFFAGGVLAPLEFLKSIGNIISYVRIAAIGLTSVLLAFTANQLGGLTGDILTGAIVAGLIHALNIVLGIFSPAIHSLRLHYVEFFSKFVEHGGRKFEPLKR